MKIHRSTFLLIGICLLCLSCCACSGFDVLTDTILAALGSLNVVLATIQTAFPNALVAAIEAADTVAQGAVNSLKSLYNNYIADKTGTGLLADLQAGIAAVQQTLAQLEASANIVSAPVIALISKIVSLVSDVLHEVATAIVPAVPAAIVAHAAGNSAPALSLNDQMKSLAIKLRSDVQAAHTASGLDLATTKAANDYIDHRLAHHIGKIRV